MVKLFPSFPSPLCYFFALISFSRGRACVASVTLATQARFRRKHKKKSPACASLRETFLSSTCACACSTCACAFACACGQGYRRHLAPCKGIRIPKSRNFLLVESEILGFGIRNPAQGIRNPTEDWNPEYNLLKIHSRSD